MKQKRTLFYVIVLGGSFAGALLVDRFVAHDARWFGYLGGALLSGWVWYEVRKRRSGESR